jgi:Protein of unknown function (DUF1360)
MTTTDDGLFAGYSPDEHRPLAGYAILGAAYVALSGGFAAWARRRGVALPERIEARDLALLGVATHKGTRLLGKDRITSMLRAPFTLYQEPKGHGEIEEAARGEGLRLAIGELLICPYCLGFWVGSGLAAGLVSAPRQTRFGAGVLTVLSVSDFLHLAYLAAQERS